MYCQEEDNTWSCCFHRAPSWDCAVQPGGELCSVSRETSRRDVWAQLYAKSLQFDNSNVMVETSANIEVFVQIVLINIEFLFCSLFFLQRNQTNTIITSRKVKVNFRDLIDWLVGCLLAGLDLWKRMLLKCSITMVFTCPLLSWCKVSSPLRENNNVVEFPFPFHISMPLANLWLIHL